MRDRRPISLLALLLLVAGPAVADQDDGVVLRVDRAAAPAGDGSSAHPFRRITDALARARLVRQGTTSPISIEVAAGDYPGAFDAPDDATEALPLVLNVADLRLRGNTVLERDQGGLPTGRVSGPATTVSALRASSSMTSVIVLIAPTADGSRGDRTTVEGFDFLMGDGLYAVAATRVTGFVLRNNIARHTGGFNLGFFTASATGVIEGNFARGLHAAIMAEGGRPGRDPDDSPRVIVRRNRGLDNDQGVCLSGADDAYVMQFQMGASGQQYLPYPAGSGPGTIAAQQLAAVVEHNDLEGNSFGGVRFSVYNYSHHPYLASANVKAVIRGNRIVGNVLAGVVVEAGFIWPGTNAAYWEGAFDPAVAAYATAGPAAVEHTFAVEATFEGNTIAGNGVGSRPVFGCPVVGSGKQAYFTFGLVYASLGCDFGLGPLDVAVRSRVVFQDRDGFLPDGESYQVDTASLPGNSVSIRRPGADR